MSQVYIRKDIYDPTNYTASTYKRMQLIAAYSARYFYTDFYNEAKNARNRRESKTITDAYRTIMNQFYKCFSVKQTEISFLTSMHRFYLEVNSSHIVDFKTFLYDIVSDFYPKECIPESIESSKCAIAAISAIKKIWTGFMKEVDSNLIALIIDDRDKANSAAIVSKHFLNIILEVRDFISRDYFATKKKFPAIELRKQMNEEIQKYEKKMQDLKTENESLKKIIREKLDIKKHVEEQKSLVTKLYEELKKKKIYISELEEKLKRVRALPAIEQKEEVPAATPQAPPREEHHIETVPESAEADEDYDDDDDAFLIE